MIEPATLRRLRLDRGLSQRQLAAAIGVDPLTVKRLEDGADPGDLPLRVLGRLTATLGAPPGEPAASPTRPTDNTEIAETIGAALLVNGRTTISDLAAALELTCTDIAAGIDVLPIGLAAVGMSLARNHDTVWLVPRHQPVTTATARCAPLTVAEARLLRRIHRGEDVARNLSYPDRTFTLPALQRRGLVDTARSRPGLADVALESLDL